MLGQFGAFTSRVKAILDQKAFRKGYGTKEDEGKELFDFVGRHFSGHPLGEIVYKCVRHRYKGDSLDLEKIAAWAYLVWQKAESKKDEAALGVGPLDLGPLDTDTSLTVFGERLAAEQSQRVRDFSEKHRDARARNL